MANYPKSPNCEKPMREADEDQGEADRDEERDLTSVQLFQSLPF